MGWRGERGTGRTAPPPADRPLVCVVESTAPVAVLRLSGPLNLATAVEVRAALHKALPAQPSAVVVDLVGLVSADGPVLTGFAALARSAAGGPRRPVPLSRPRPEA